jgi:hypothetical protein
VSGVGLSDCGFHRDKLPILSASGKEAYIAICGSKQSMITATPDIQSRMELRPTLADEDIPRGDELAAELLHAQAF